MNESEYGTRIQEPVDSVVNGRASRKTRAVRRSRQSIEKCGLDACGPHASAGDANSGCSLSGSTTGCYARQTSNP